MALHLHDVHGGKAIIDAYLQNVRPAQPSYTDAWLPFDYI